MRVYNSLVRADKEYSFSSNKTFLFVITTASILGSSTNLIIEPGLTPLDAKVKSGTLTDFSFLESY